MTTTPTQEQTVEAWLTLKAAGVFPLLCITADEIVDGSENTVTEQQARDAAERMQKYWDVSDEWQAAIEYAVNEAKGWKEDQS